MEHSVTRSTHVFEASRMVSLRLRALKIPLGLLDDVRTSWSAAEASTTPFEPATAGGSKAWFAGTGTLRERLAGDGWTAVDAMNWPVVIEPRGRWGVCVTSGDEMTGLVIGDRQPSTRNPKGLVVASVVHMNNQLPLAFDEPSATAQPRRVSPSVIPPTWFLLLAATETELRAELSLPDAMEGDWISHWSQRIILPPIARGGGSVFSTLPESYEAAPVPVVTVRRKKVP